jgi:hypothetical protein
MGSAKDLRVAPIKAADANRLVQRLHYSGKFVQNSQLHLGVFLGNALEGVMQFGPSLDKRKMQSLVEKTNWNSFIELNRMAFSERLPRNSESRAIAVAMRLLRHAYPHLEWIVSFADGTQCGDGTIYRAAGFLLTGIKPSVDLWLCPDGEVRHSMNFKNARPTPIQRQVRQQLGMPTASEGQQLRRWGATPLPGFQLRYIYFLNPAARERLTVPILPFSKIAEMGATMYRGQGMRPKQATPETIGEAAGQNRPGRSK